MPTCTRCRGDDSCRHLFFGSDAFVDRPDNVHVSPLSAHSASEQKLQQQSTTPGFQFNSSLGVWCSRNERKPVRCSIGECVLSSLAPFNNQNSIQTTPPPRSKPILTP